MMKVIPFLICLYIITILPGYLYGQKKIRLNLNDILYLAEKNDPELISYQFNAKGYLAEQDEAEKAFYPKIESELQKSNSVSYSNPRGTTIFTFSNSIEQPLYNRSLIYTKRKADKKVLENRYAILERLNNLQLEIIELYYSIITLKKVISIREEEYLKAKESYRLSSLRLKHNRNIPLDVLLNESLMLETKLEMQKAYHDYDEEKLKLRKKINLKQDFVLNIDERPLKGSYKLESCIQTALSTRVDLKKMLMESKVKKLEYEIAQSAYYPELQLESNYTLTSRDSYDLNDRRDWSIFLTLSMALGDDVKAESKAGFEKDYRMDAPKDTESVSLTIFDKSTRKSTKAHALSSYKTTQYKIKELKNEIIFEVTEAFNNVLEAQENLELAKLRVRLGEGLVRKAQSEIKTGRKDVEDLVEAKQKNITYRIEKEKAIQNYRYAVINLKWAMGTLHSLSSL